MRNEDSALVNIYRSFTQKLATVSKLHRQKATSLVTTRPPHRKMHLNLTSCKLSINLTEKYDLFRNAIQAYKRNIHFSVLDRVNKYEDISIHVQGWKSCLYSCNQMRQDVVLPLVLDKCTQWQGKG